MNLKEKYEYEKALQQQRRIMCEHPDELIVRKTSSRTVRNKDEKVIAVQRQEIFQCSFCGRSETYDVV